MLQTFGTADRLNALIYALKKEATALLKLCTQYLFIVERVKDCCQNVNDTKEFFISRMTNELFMNVRITVRQE